MRLAQRRRHAEAEDIDKNTCLTQKEEGGWCLYDIQSMHTIPTLPVNKVHDDNALKHSKGFVSVSPMNTIISWKIILGALKDCNNQGNSCEQVCVQHVEHVDEPAKATKHRSWQILNAQLHKLYQHGRVQSTMVRHVMFASRKSSAKSIRQSNSSSEMQPPMCSNTLPSPVQQLQLMAHITWYICQWVTWQSRGASLCSSLP